MGPRLQAGFTFFTHGLHPFFDGPCRNIQGFGDFLKRPPLALEFKGSIPTHLFPVGSTDTLFAHAPTVSVARHRGNLSMQRSIIAAWKTIFFAPEHFLL